MTEQVIGEFRPCTVHDGVCLEADVHAATARRERVVERASRAMNFRGVNFQEQRWTASRKRRRKANGHFDFEVKR